MERGGYAFHRRGSVTNYYMNIHSILDPLKESTERIESAHGYIDINPQPKFTDRPSIVNLYVDDEYRGRGEGTELVKKALEMYPNLGGQAGSIAGVVTMYKAGMRPYKDRGASLDRAVEMFSVNESLYMVSVEE